MRHFERKLNGSEEEKFSYFLKIVKEEALFARCCYASIENMIVLLKLAGNKNLKVINELQSYLKKYIDTLEKFSIFMIYNGALIVTLEAYYDDVTKDFLLELKRYLKELEEVSLRVDILDYFGSARHHVSGIGSDIFEFL